MDIRIEFANTGAAFDKAMEIILVDGSSETKETDAVDRQSDDESNPSRICHYNEIQRFELSRYVGSMKDAVVDCVQ